jgi:UDP-glucose 4-epimerase
MTERRRVLVVGAGGHIGRRVCAALVAAGHDVHGTDRQRSGDLPEGLSFHPADIRKRSFDQVLRDAEPDTVVHLARVRGFDLTGSLRHRVNFEGAVRVLDKSLAAGAKKIVFLSRHTVYGALPDQPQFLTEDHPPNAGRTFPEIDDLVAADLYACGLMWKHPDREIVVLRPVNIVGPTVRTILARYLRRKRTFTIAGFDPVYQIIHEDDVAAAVRVSLEKGVRGVFNVEGGGALPLHRLIEAVGARRVAIPGPMLSVASGRLGLPVVPRGAMDFLRYPCTVDGSRFREATGFTPAFGLRAIVESMRGEA